MEPRAATPMRRLETLRRLAQVGVPTTVMVAPVIPALNEMEIERILDAAATAGVKEAGYVLLRLPLEVRDLFGEWLTANFPNRANHVFKLIRETRGGKDTTDLGQAYERHRALRLDDRPALPDGLREAGLEYQRSCRFLRSIFAIPSRRRNSSVCCEARRNSSRKARFFLSL